MEQSQRECMITFDFAFFVDLQNCLIGTYLDKLLANHHEIKIPINLPWQKEKYTHFFTPSQLG